MGIYLYWKGLVELAGKAKGNENVLIGARPNGFHAGSELALFVYPWHLCNEIKKQGKEASFSFTISLNDMEPAALKYLLFDEEMKQYFCDEEKAVMSGAEHNYNIFPKTTSFQFMPDKYNCCISAVDHWENLLRENIARLKKDFPGITINIVRASTLKNSDLFSSVILGLLKNPKELGEIISRHSSVCFNEGALNWAGAICPLCHSANGNTLARDKKVFFDCNNCGESGEYNFAQASFWVHHLAILPPRLRLFETDICILGNLQYAQKYVDISRAWHKKLYGESLFVDSLIVPVVSESKSINYINAQKKPFSNVEKLKDCVVNKNSSRLSLK